MAHGEVTGHTRQCDVHGEHGLLYPCPQYTEETLYKISSLSNKYVANLRSKTWCEQQIKNGVSIPAVEIFRAMAGIDNDDWTA